MEIASPSFLGAPNMRDSCLRRLIERGQLLLHTWLQQADGTTAVIIALTLPICLGLMGLGTEAGYWYFRQRQLQTAADLSAFAGAVALRNGQTSGSAEVTAEAEVTNFNINGTAVANAPPTSGTHQNPQSMEVILTETQPRFFSQFFDSSTLKVTTRAVATYDDGAPACILALDKSAGKSVWFQGSSVTTLLGCEVMANSVAGNAVEVDGSAQLTTPCINAVGGVTLNNSNVTLTGCPAPRTNLPPAVDPYAGISAPAVLGPCVDGTYNNVGVISPLHYCKLDLKGTILLNPGVYIIDGGAFKINASANVSINPAAPADAVTGLGVMFYLMNHATVSFNGTATINLAAPTTGIYKGILFMADKNTQGTGDAVTINGNASSKLVGALYFPTQIVSFTGNYSSLNKCIAIVSQQVQLSGNSDLNSDCTNNSSITLPQIPGRVTLVE